MWRNSPKNKFEDEIYIGSIDVLPEISSLPHKPKRVTMALAKGRVEELELSILRRVAENYGGRTIENIIQNYEQIIKERDESNKKKYVQETHICEQKSADKVEPKFKVGDWIVTDKNHIWLIDEDCSTTGYSYRLISQNGKVEVGDYNIVDEHARLWTIQDAKDGDVLVASDDSVFIYAGSTDRHAQAGQGQTLIELYNDLKKL